MRARRRYRFPVNMKILLRFLRFPFFVQVVCLLCVLGALVNGVLMVRDLANGAVLLRLHIGFFILYAAQVVFILTQEKFVALLTLLQGVMALLTTADFIFVPLLQIAGHLYYWVCAPSLEAMKEYQYIFMALGFTLQLASAAYLWGYFKGKGGKKVN